MIYLENQTQLFDSGDLNLNIEHERPIKLKWCWLKV